jgi:CHASE3 domain sensor protein
MWLRQINAGKGLIIALVVGFLAVEGIVAACVLSLMHFKTSNNWATRSEQVLIELERVRSIMTGAETHQRGYLITGSPILPHRSTSDRTKCTRPLPRDGPRDFQLPNQS